jgi:hypothetical protein
MDKNVLQRVPNEDPKALITKGKKVFAKYHLVRVEKSLLFAPCVGVDYTFSVCSQKDDRVTFICSSS